MDYTDLKRIFQELKRNSPNEDLTAHVIFTEDSFDRPYPLLSRTYSVSSDNKAFWSRMGGRSIFAYCLDKTSDQGVRLDWYMEEEGNTGGWKVQDCYILEGRAEWEERLKRSEEQRGQNVPIFHNKIFCGECGAHMRYQRLVKFPERRTGSYSCPNYRYGRCSQPLTITQDKVKAIVRQTVSDQLSICCDYETVLERLNNGDTTAKMEGYRSEIQSLSIQLNNRRDKRERLYEDFSDGILSPEEYMAMKKKYDAEYQEISAKLMDIQTRLMRLKKSLSGNNEWLVHIRQFVGAEKFSQEMVDALVEAIKVYQDENGGKRIEIIFKYAADRELLEEACGELVGGAVVVGKALRDQERPLREIHGEVLTEIENQVRRRAAAIGPPDFLHNVRLDSFESVRHIEDVEVRRFQLRIYDSPQQVQAVVALPHGDAPGTHFYPPLQSKKICPLSAALFFHPLP